MPRREGGMATQGRLCQLQPEEAQAACEIDEKEAGEAGSGSGPERH